MLTSADHIETVPNATHAQLSGRWQTFHTKFSRRPLKRLPLDSPRVFRLCSPMKRDTLASFPYVKVRLACRKCCREGSYSLARLADKYGARSAWMTC